MTLCNDLFSYLEHQVFETDFGNWYLEKFDEFFNKHPIIKQYYNTIDADYYCYVNSFIKYVTNHKLHSFQIKNPLFEISDTYLETDITNTNKFYNSLQTAPDIYSYAIDFILDTSLMGTLAFNNLDIRPSTVINQFNKASPKNINELFDILEYNTNASKATIETIEKIIILTDSELNKIKKLKNSIHNIFYRNKKAKCAWIHKLAHYLVDNIILKIGDETIDCHISDWFEANSQLSETDGHIEGYYKMIGHRENLTTFDDSTKDACTITLPLVFYFNKHISLSLPLNASCNTNYKLDICLRNLTDVVYKEQFSEFVDVFDREKIINPKINKCYLMAEYIFLGKQERQIFITNCLEYLITELQYADKISITDSKLEPLYAVRSGKKYSYIAKNQLVSNHIDPGVSDAHDILLSKKNYIMSSTINKNGIQHSMFIDAVIKNTDEKIHKKKLQIENFMYHPTKYMIILIKPDIHVNTDLRINEKQYFYGEKQWDNYSLYSRYNLTKIHTAKKEHYKNLKTRINDLDDEYFGIQHILDILIERDDDVIIKQIRNAYLDYNGPLTYNVNLSKLREDIVRLGIKFPIFDEKILNFILHEIYGNSIKFAKKINHLTNSHNIYTYSDFINIVYNLDTELNFKTDTTIFNNIYDKYNDFAVNLFINSLNDFINLETLEYSFKNIVENFHNWILLNRSDDSLLIISDLILSKIRSYTPLEIELINKIKIKNVTFVDVINQLINEPNINTYPRFVSYSIIKNLASEMNTIRNELLESLNVDTINYQKHMEKNTEINPLVDGYLSFNDVPIMPENSSSVVWSEMESYKHFNRTPSTGINVKSWALDPLNFQPSGTANLSRISKFTSDIELDPMIGDKYPATYVAMCHSINMIRYLSGMCGRVWSRDR